MATVQSDQVAAVDADTGKRLRPIDTHGKLRIDYFYYKNNTGGTLADGTEIDLLDLPPGAVRLLLPLCMIKTTAMGASRVLDLGTRAYSQNPAADMIVEDDDQFIANLDVSGAVARAAWQSPSNTLLKFDLYSKAGVRLYATIDGGTIPSLAEIEGYVVYVYE